METRDALVERFERTFPVKPIPEWSRDVWLGPFGDDEFASFAGAAWSGIYPELLEASYDIPPWDQVGSQDCLHLLNYYFPGFLVGDIMWRDPANTNLDGIRWFLSRLRPSWFERGRCKVAEWWESDRPFGNYTRAQVECVVDALRFLREREGLSPEVVERWENLLD